MSKLHTQGGEKYPLVHTGAETLTEAVSALLPHVTAVGARVATRIPASAVTEEALQVPELRPQGCVMRVFDTLAAHAEDDCTFLSLERVSDKH